VLYVAAYRIFPCSSVSLMKPVSQVSLLNSEPEKKGKRKCGDDFS
jgi:hypothetical protein